MNVDYNFINTNNLEKLPNVPKNNAVTPRKMTKKARFYIHANNVNQHCRQTNAWLDYKKLCEDISKERGDIPVDIAVYFSTNMHSKENFIYVSYIEKLKESGIEVVMGARDNNNRKKEKQTLVNMASRLIYDAWDSNFSEMYVLTIENDLAHGIKYTKRITPDNKVGWVLVSDTPNVTKKSCEELTEQFNKEEIFDYSSDFMKKYVFSEGIIKELSSTESKRDRSRT